MIEDYNLDNEEKKFSKTAKNIFPNSGLRPFSRLSNEDKFVPGTFDIDNVDCLRPGDSFDT